LNTPSRRHHGRWKPQQCTIQQISSLLMILEDWPSFVGYKKRRIRRAKKRSNAWAFRAPGGSIPCICAMIWEDLQTTTKSSSLRTLLKVEYFLMAMHHLKLYPVSVEREGIFDISFKWGRDKVWYYVERYKPSRHRRLFGQMTWRRHLGSWLWMEQLYRNAVKNAQMEWRLLRPTASAGLSLGNVLDKRNDSPFLKVSAKWTHLLLLMCQTTNFMYYTKTCRSRHVILIMRWFENLRAVHTSNLPLMQQKRFPVGMEVDVPVINTREAPKL
jgi:hypothetical protein